MLVWNEEGKYNTEYKKMDKPDYALISGVNENEKMEKRMERVEQQLETIQNHLQQLTKANDSTKKDMRFFEAMLLEEYHLLLQLLGKDQNLTIHQVSGPTS